MVLKEKERAAIEDLQSQEKTCIEKYAKYAEQAKDPVLKDLFRTLQQEEQKHYQSLGYKVAIQTPTEKDFNKVLTSLYEQPRQQQSMTEDEEDEEGLGR